MLRGWGPLLFLSLGFFVGLVLYHQFDVRVEGTGWALAALGAVILVLLWHERLKR